MKNLHEWVDKTGNKIVIKNTSSPTAPTGSGQSATDMWGNLDSWNRLVDKVTKYIKSRPELSDLKIDSRSNGKLQVLRIYDNLPEGHDIVISYNIGNELFVINAEYDGFQKIPGKGFNSLMTTLQDTAFTIFELGSFDFLSLRECLREWLDANGNKVVINSTSSASVAQSSTLSTTGYKDKFKKLLDFNEKHMRNNVINAEIKNLNDYGFHYYELCTDSSGSKYERDVLVGISNDNDRWAIIECKNKQTVNSENGSGGFSELLKTLGMYIKRPPLGTLEYRNILESNEGTFAGEFKLYESLWD